MAQPQKLTVFYDGDCPLCRREIGFYQRRKGAGRIEWRDVSALPAGAVAKGLSKCEAMARFHVMDADGAYFSGAEGFAKLWAALPSFRWLGLAAQVKPVLWLLERLYEWFLTVRPRLQKSLRADAQRSG